MSSTKRALEAAFRQHPAWMSHDLSAIVCVFYLVYISLQAHIFYHRTTSQRLIANAFSLARTVSTVTSSYLRTITAPLSPSLLITSSHKPLIVLHTTRCQIELFGVS